MILDDVCVCINKAIIQYLKIAYKIIGPRNTNKKAFQEQIQQTFKFIFKLHYFGRSLLAYFLNSR